MLVRDIRGERIRRLELPDVPALRKEIKTYREMLAERDAATRRLRELEAERPAAKRRDQEVFGQAILKSGPAARDPGAKPSTKLESEIADVRARRDAADFAVDKAEESLLAAIDQKREGLLRDTDKNLKAVDAEYGDCVERLLEVRQRRDELGSLRFWVQGFPHQTTQLSTRPRSVAGIKKQNGQQVTGVELAAALREDAAETPAPKANTMPIPEADPLVAA
jgi:uncharacterized protein YhaN